MERNCSKIDLICGQTTQKEGEGRVRRACPRLRTYGDRKGFGREPKMEQAEESGFFLFLASVVSSLVSHEEVRSRRQSPLDEVPEGEFSTGPFDVADNVLENFEFEEVSLIRAGSRPTTSSICDPNIG